MFFKRKENIEIAYKRESFVPEYKIEQDPYDLKWDVYVTYERSDDLPNWRCLTRSGIWAVENNSRIRPYDSLQAAKEFLDRYLYPKRSFYDQYGGPRISANSITAQSIQASRLIV